MSAADTRTFGNATVTTVKLPVMAALDLVPDLLAIVGPAGGAYYGGDTMGDTLGKVAQALLGGRLTALLPRVLAGCSVVIPGRGNIALLSREAIDKALADHEELLIPLVKTALEVQFKRFFPGFALAELQIPTGFPSASSSPSTNDTGPSTASG